MTRRFYILVAVLAGATGLGSYTATVATRSASQPAASSDDATNALASWLSASADQRAQLRQADPGFAGELKELRAEVATQRAALASLLEKPGVTDEQIMAGLEKVIASNNSLERRVARYVLTVRDHLTIEQQRQLLNLCAEEVRRGRGYQWGRQQGGQPNSPQPGMGGRGPGPRGHRARP